MEIFFQASRYVGKCKGEFICMNERMFSLIMNKSQNIAWTHMHLSVGNLTSHLNFFNHHPTISPPPFNHS